MELSGKNNINEGYKVVDNWCHLYNNSIKPEQFNFASEFTIKRRQRREGKPTCPNKGRDNDEIQILQV